MRDVIVTQSTISRFPSPTRACSFSVDASTGARVYLTAGGVLTGVSRSGVVAFTARACAADDPDGMSADDWFVAACAAESGGVFCARKSGVVTLVRTGDVDGVGSSARASAAELIGDVDVGLAAMAASPDGAAVALLTLDGNVVILSASSGDVVGECAWGAGSLAREERGFIAWTADARALAVSAVPAAGPATRKIYIFDVDSVGGPVRGRSARREDGRALDVFAAAPPAWAPSGNSFAAALAPPSNGGVAGVGIFEANGLAHGSFILESSSSSLSSSSPSLSGAASAQPQALSSRVSWVGWSVGGGDSVVAVAVETEKRGVALQVWTRDAYRWGFSWETLVGDGSSTPSSACFFEWDAEKPLRLHAAVHARGEVQLRVFDFAHCFRVNDGGTMASVDGGCRIRLTVRLLT